MTRRTDRPGGRNIPTPPPAELRCREFAFGSETYRQAMALREAVLRRPLGLTWEAGAFAGEAQRDPPPDAFGGSGDEHGLSGESGHG